ncbi:MAG: phospholipid scramblase-related protein [Acidimicrobiales bacterium]
MTNVGGAAPSGWHPDPFGRHEYRWWDGTRWTEQVASHGQQGTDPAVPGPGSGVPVVNHSAQQIQHQVQARAGVAPMAGAGGGTIFTEPVLVVNQKAKLIEISAEYAIFNQEGNQIGAVRQVGQSMIKKVVRVVSSLDQFMTHSFQVVDMAGNVQLALTRPAKLVKSKVEIRDAQGTVIGLVQQENMVGKIRFGLMVGGERIGSINAENWRAWNFSIQDAGGNEVARITKTWEGLAKTLFTTADNYVVQIHHALPEPLRSMVVASALCVDTALKQDSRGFN